MKNIRLIRQNHENPDFTELNAMRKELEQLLASDLDAPDFDWASLVDSLTSFQAKDGSFNLLDSYNIESDCRVDYCHEPTYICTALLMKAYLQSENLLRGKEQTILSRAMHMCCERGLEGHGYDSLSGLIFAVNCFLKCGVVEFLERYPDICQEFTEMFAVIREDFEFRVDNEQFLGTWGESYEDSIRSINDAFQCTGIFVYGTLMKGQRNHDAFLRDESFVGTGTIEGYDMYDLGSFPGITGGTGKVYGEVYRVTPEELKRIDRLEGEGFLYKKVRTSVRMADSSEMHAFVYMYLQDVAGCEQLRGKYGEKMVWYIAYGSNLLEERLRYYIQGGLCPANGKRYSACRNTDMPADSRQVMIPYNMFYSNYDRGSWENSAVCFMDFSQPGEAYGRAYLVTEEQLKHIHRQEGRGANWYPEMVRLDDIDGIPAYTCGGYQEKEHEPFCRVSSEYGIILCRGLHEAYPELSGREIMEYLRNCGK